MAIAAFKTCFQEIMLCKQLLITEFEVGTVSQGPILCRSDLWFMREQSKMRLRDFSSDWENEASKIFLISFGLRLQFKQNFVFSGLYSEIWPA